MWQAWRRKQRIRPGSEKLDGLQRGGDWVEPQRADEFD